MLSKKYLLFSVITFRSKGVWGKVSFSPPIIVDEVGAKCAWAENM